MTFGDFQAMVPPPGLLTKITVFFQYPEFGERNQANFEKAPLIPGGAGHNPKETLAQMDWSRTRTGGASRSRAATVTSSLTNSAFEDG